MGTFKREGGFNDRKGPRDFKPGGRGGFGPSRGSSDRGGDRGERQMYKAICSECRRTCEVPFRPTGDKPVYCSNCFSAQNEAGGSRGDRSFDRPSFDRPRPSFDKPRFEERKSFSATCDKCGNQCDLPFRPTPGKPVFCSACFTKPEGRGGSVGGSKSCDCQENYKNLSAKLDKIMKALNIAVETPKSAPVKNEPVKEVFGDMETLTEDKPAKSARGGVNKAKKESVKKEKVVEKEISEVVKSAQGGVSKVVKVKEIKEKKVKAEPKKKVAVKKAK